ncbi:hypothetical protein BT96DRAFT_987893 [Gymnopus androsaceus JB14]|uniref:F-box domain-containing protein n=1 Tax=Gymnopus androsaceus JB14 TaxID=1447944 RepID=A0A6A4I7U3_9AGAR|nr:hypothetical protein BT96DRAFT_987893 [Gymnopus androsaceus JB14]
MAQYLQSRIEVPVWLEPNDISFLRTRISEAETLVQTFESRMDELRAQISELSRQKDAKLVEIASLRNVLAPVRRLPLEILSENIRAGFRISPVTAHAAPPLWSTLRIDMEAHILGSGYTWVNDWFTRSQMRGKKFLEYILTQLGHKVRLLDVVGYPSSFLPILHLSPSSFTALIGRISLYESSKMMDDTIARSGGPFPSKIRCMLLGAPKLRQAKLNDCFSSKIAGTTGRAIDLTERQSMIDELDFDPVMFVDILLRCKQLVNLDNLIGHQILLDLVRGY